MTTLTRKEREDLSLLLPWYAAGTLDEADAARIDAALEGDEALRAELEIVLEDQAAALDVVEREEVPASMEARFHAALERSIAQDQRDADQPATRKPGLLDRVAALLAPPRRLAFAAAAAALLIVVQGGVIVSLVNNPGGATGYTTASGDTVEPADGLFVLVRFAGGATAADISAWLAGHEAKIVDGPLPGSMFRLRFPQDAAADNAALAGKIGTEHTVFALVLPAQ